MSKKKSVLGLSESKEAEFHDIFILLSIYNFMLSGVSHEKSFTTSGPGLIGSDRGLHCFPFHLHLLKYQTVPFL